MQDGKKTHPSEVDHQLQEHDLQKLDVARATSNLPLDLEHPERSPGVDWWIDIAEVPFVCWNLAVWFHVPLPRQQVQLLLGEAWIDNCKGDAMERGIPGCKERVFPPAFCLANLTFKT